MVSVFDFCEPSNLPGGTTLWKIDNTHYDLSEVHDYPSLVALIRDAAKKKGMRFDEASFPDGEIAHLKQNVVVFRGSAHQFLNSLLEGAPSNG